MAVAAMDSHPGGSITFIADGIFRSDCDPSVPLSRRLPPSLARLQGASVSESRDARTLDQCVVEICFPAQSSTSDQPCLPLASFSYAADVDAVSARDHHWLRCDPVKLSVGARGLSLTTLQPDEMSDAESSDLAQTVASVLHDFGLKLETPSSQRWYVACDRLPEVSFSPPWLAQRDGVDVCMPQGPEAAHWVERMSACQIALYADPVNQRREQSATEPVSSVWFWGSAERSGTDELWVDQIYGDSVIARGIGLYADRFTTTLPESATPGHLLFCYENCESTQSQAALQFLLSSWRSGAVSRLAIIDPRLGEVVISSNFTRFTGILRRWRSKWSRLRDQAN